MIGRTSIVACCAILATMRAPGGELRVHNAAATGRVPALLVQSAEKVLRQSGVTGAAIAVVSRQGVEWATGVGYADCAGSVPATADTVFRVGSISKTVIALGVMRLVEEGRLRLDAKVADLLPDVPIDNPWERTHPLLLVHLLDHTAGLDDMLFSEAYVPSGAVQPDLRDTLRIFHNELRVRWPPGTRMSYSNTGYGVIGYIIERVTGQRFDSYIKADVLRPLGMASSDFALTEPLRESLAVGCVRPHQAVPYREIYLRPAGDLKSTAEDFGRLIQMILQGGIAADGTRFLTSDSIRLMEETRTSVAASVGLRNGYGLGIMTGVDLPLLTRFHNGSIDGFSSIYRYVPAIGKGYLVFLNATNPGQALNQLDRMLFAAVTAGVRSSPTTPFLVAPSALRELTGTYVLRSPRLQQARLFSDLFATRNAYVSGSTLYIRDFGGAPQQLIPVSSSLFRGTGDSGASIAFRVYKGGRAVMSNGSGNYYERTSAAGPLLRWTLLLAGILAMVFELLFGIVLIFRRRLRMSYPPSLRRAHLALSLGILALFGAIFIAPGVSSTAPRSGPAIAIYLLTITYPILVLAGLLLVSSAMRSTTTLRVRAFSMTVATLCSALALYLAFYGLMPLKLWAV